MKFILSSYYVYIVKYDYSKNEVNFMKKHPILVLTGVSVLATMCTKMIKSHNEKNFLN